MLSFIEYSNIFVLYINSLLVGVWEKLWISLMNKAQTF
jgi:hypothetical protein